MLPFSVTWMSPAAVPCCFGAFLCLELIFASFSWYPWQLAGRFWRWDSHSITALLELALQQDAAPTVTQGRWAIQSTSHLSWPRAVDAGGRRQPSVQCCTWGMLREGFCSHLPLPEEHKKSSQGQQELHCLVWSCWEAKQSKLLEGLPALCDFIKSLQ